MENNTTISMNVTPYVAGCVLDYLRHNYEIPARAAYDGENLVIGPVESAQKRRELRAIAMHVMAVARSGAVSDASSHEMAARQGLVLEDRAQAIAQALKTGSPREWERLAAAEYVDLSTGTIVESLE